MGGELSNNYSPDQFRDENGRFGVSEVGHKLIESYGGYAACKRPNNEPGRVFRS